MESKSELEKYTEYGLSGSPQIKGNEKKYWLGEFRERVVFALTYEQIGRREAIKVVEEKLKDDLVDKIIIHNRIINEIEGKYMDLAKKYNKNYKSIDLKGERGEIALVLASKKAVNVETVLADQLPLLPDKFYGLRNNKLCKKHMEELEREAPMFLDEFKEITILDKMMGIQCGACKNEEKNISEL